MTQSEKEWMKRKPKSLVVSRQLILYESEGLAVLDVALQAPELDAKQAEAAAAWLKEFSEWRSGLDLIRKNQIA